MLEQDLHSPGEDRREVRLALTTEGKRKFHGAVYYWRSAQKQLRRVLGETGWKQIMESAISTAARARQR